MFVLGCGEKSEETTPENNAQQTQEKDGGAISWQAPDGWIEETPKSGFRKAQYRLPKAEGDLEDASCVVFFFPGGAGGVQANIQRWYGQFVQPDGRPSSEVATVTTKTVNGLKQTRIDLPGTFLSRPTPGSPQVTEKSNFRMLAAIVETGGESWFVKLVGPQKTVAKWKESFYDFMNSFEE